MSVYSRCIHIYTIYMPPGVYVCIKHFYIHIYTTYMSPGVYVCIWMCTYTINLVAKMRLGGRCLVRKSPSGAQGGNHGNPAKPTTRTPVTLIISGELHSILTKGSGGRGNDRNRSAGKRSVMVAKRERKARNMCCMLCHGQGIT